MYCICLASGRSQLSRLVSGSSCSVIVESGCIPSEFLSHGPFTLTIVVSECNREWVLKKCANRNVLGSYYVPAEFLFW